VGDRQQLAQIANTAADGLTAPGSAYDYQRQSILSSLGDLYGDQLPVTLLREHYRCDPAIIGYCNKAFYGGDLILYTTPGSGRPMTVARTVAGNHMRQHRAGGRSNQREVDVIVNEVIPYHCTDVPPTDIGITTPYNLQVDKVAAAVFADIQAATVHKFQGRQKTVVILTTVLDETWRGQTGHAFVDEPKDQRCSLASGQKFILVINNELMASAATSET
jgi:AAA domain